MSNTGVRIQACVVGHFRSYADQSVDEKEKSLSDLGIGSDMRSWMNDVDESPSALRYQTGALQFSFSLSYGANEYFIRPRLVILYRSKNWQGDLLCAHLTAGLIDVIIDESSRRPPRSSWIQRRSNPQNFASKLAATDENESSRSHVDRSPRLNRTRHRA